MAKPPLSMKPTGWFQVAWSDEIGVGDVHRMKYFDQEMVAWRAESGQLDRDERLLRTPRRPPRVTAATSRARCCSARSTGGSGTRRAATCASPTRTAPTAAGASAPIRWSSATSRSTSGTTSSDREPFFDAPDVFAGFGDGSSACRLLPAAAVVPSRAWRLHPQYVLENGVDFAHFKYVHNTPIVPVFTRHDFDEPVSYVDFTITFEGDDGQTIEDVNSGVEAINGGLGIAVTKSWGMVDNRTISAITPVDESTSDVRFMVYIGRTPRQGPGAGRGEGARVRRGSHPAVRAGRPHLAAPALFGSARAGQRELRGLHRHPQVGQAVLSRRHRRQRRRSVRRSTERLNPHECIRSTDPGVPGRDRQRRLGDDQADRRPSPTSNSLACTATRRTRSAGTPASSPGWRPTA